MAVDLKPHNLETYNKVKEIFKTKNRACCVQPTGSGKSYLALKLFEDNPSARKLVLEPQHYIREQLQAKVTEDMGTVQFITYSKLAKMSDEDIAALEPDIIVLDEFHRAGAKEWGGKGVQRLLESYPESKVLGLSATPIRYLDSGRNMAEELFDGAMANNMSLAEAIVQRILPLPRYICGLYCLDGEVESINKKIEQSYNNPEEKKTLLKQVREMKKQLDKSNGVSSIFRKYILEPNGKYIVFCKDIKHLNQMKPMLEQWFADAGFKNIRAYTVHSKNENKDAEFKKFKEDDGDGIRLCLVVSMLNEGVHVDGIDGVIMLRNTISAGLFFQQIGRAISCNSKGIPLILDLVANAQSVTECNLKTDIEREIQKERERNKGFSSEGLEVEKFFIMDEVLDVVSAFKGIEERLVDSWDVMFQEYLEFFEKHGHGDIPKSKEYKKLNNWCVHQRCNELLNEYRRKLLNNNGFIWDIPRYRFEKQVISVREFVCEYGYYPKGGSQNKYESNLGYFISAERSKKRYSTMENTYPQWKLEILNRVMPDFCWEPLQETFETFLHFYKDYKKGAGNGYIRKDFIFKGYKLGKQISILKASLAKGSLPEDKKQRLIEEGIYLEDGKDLRYKRNWKLLEECVSKGNILNSCKKKYQGVDLYSWIRGTVRKHIDEGEVLTDEQWELLQRAMQERTRPIKIVDLINHQEYVYLSINKAARVMCSEHHVAKSVKSCITTIRNYLSGKTRSPYKGRFIFQYADTTAQSEPA